MRNLIIAILMLGTVATSAQSRMSSAETSYLYDMDHEFLIDHRIATEGNSYKVYLRFRLNSGMVKISDYDIGYDLRNSYIDEKLLNSGAKLDTSHIVGNGFREFFYAFEFEKEEDQNLLVIQIDNIAKNRRYLKDIALSTKSSAISQPFLIFDAETDLPVFDPYVSTDARIKIKNVVGSSSSFSMTGRENNAPIAIPPFDDATVNELAEIRLDTVYGVKADEEFQFSNPGFYEVTDNDDPTSVMGLLVTDSYFPYYSQYADMIMPLIYISTNQEFNVLLAADDQKSKFESFVLNTISSNTNIAQEFIKYYYRRLRKSAQLFSTSAEGWKTDRGMVYQVYGDPAQVFRNENTELWVYSLENGGRTRFIFDILPGPAGTTQYKLIRGKKYREGWMNAVTRWRSGRIIE
ncbi:MAG: GWxTD domain-containing protein [Roseivirga sp.]|nr:GWxTD domain-containing protein [Roseivirga sp.]